MKLSLSVFLTVSTAILSIGNGATSTAIGNVVISKPSTSRFVEYRDKPRHHQFPMTSLVRNISPSPIPSKTSSSNKNIIYVASIEDKSKTIGKIKWLPITKVRVGNENPNGSIGHIEVNGSFTNEDGITLACKCNTGVDDTCILKCDKKFKTNKRSNSFFQDNFIIVGQSKL